MRKSMGSRVGIGAGALLGLCLAALPAAAQQERNVTTSKDRGDTVKVTVSGNVVLDYVYRSREMTAFTDTFTAYTAPATPSIAENTFEGYVAARLDIEMSDKVSALVEFGTKRVDGGAILRWGGVSASGIDLREAAVIMNDFLTADLKAQLGVTTWSFDVRGKGSSMAFDPRHSQSLTRNLSGAITLQETGNGRLALAAAPEELESVGSTLTYSRNNLTFDLVLLPAAIEGGAIHGDEALYAIDGWYKLDDKGSRIGMILAHSTLPGVVGGNSHVQLNTFGIGADVKSLAEGLEVYAEVYFQFGQAGENAVGDTIRANGRAAQAGVEYHLKSENDIWFGINFTWMSGDDDTSASDNKASRFVGYENIHDLMILEDQYFGFDWDSNMSVVKLMGGASFSVGGGKNNLEVSAILGNARTAKKVGFTGTTETSRKLGNEIDAKVSWHLNHQASLSLGVGYLFSSDVLEKSMDATGYTAKQSLNNAWMYTLGVDVKF